MNDGYSCKECGLAVIVRPDGTIIRACKHTGTIIAGMNAVAKGISKVEHTSGNKTS
jgi:ribosomal protein L37AE/L43A